ncbi:MAG: toprim domain-containing protein [bacterium]
MSNAKHFKSYKEQVKAHINFLRSEGLEVDELTIGTNATDPIACFAIGDTESGEKKYEYKTKEKQLAQGHVGLNTWANGKNGKVWFLSNGPRLAKNVGVNLGVVPKKTQQDQEAAAKLAFIDWIEAKETGASAYLNNKKVRAYGLKYTQTDEYGNSAMVPMYDQNGKLWNIQYLNERADESGKNKIMYPESRTKELFYALTEPKDGSDIGIAESYATAATCYELTNIPTICAFSARNLPAIAQIFRKKYPTSKIIIFADNDRPELGSSKENLGIKYAKEAIETISSNAIIIAPDFKDIPATKDACDWNDLVRLKGASVAKEQIEQKLSKK